MGDKRKYKDHVPHPNMRTTKQKRLRLQCTSYTNNTITNHVTSELIVPSRTNYMGVMHVTDDSFDKVSPKDKEDCILNSSSQLEPFGRLDCDLCGEVFTHSRKLKKHLQHQHHVIEQKFEKSTQNHIGVRCVSSRLRRIMA